MELTGYLAVARRWWWTLLVATWVAAVSGYVVASQIPPTYEAETQLLVGPYNTDRETLAAAGALVQTYSQLVTTTPMLESALTEVGVDIPPEEFARSVRATANDTTRFLSIRVQDTDPRTAADLANALAGEISQLASRGTSRPEGQLQVVQTAVLPTEPIAPQKSLIVGLAALAALVGAMVLVMLVEYLNASVRTEDELERLTGLPFLGKVDTSRSVPTSPRALIDQAPESAAAAAYRLVVAKVAAREHDRPVVSVVVVGTASDGMSGQVAANLAAITARGGRQVILIDADTVDAPVSRIFGLRDRAGLTDVIASGSRDVPSKLVRVSATLRVLPRGVLAGDDAIDVGEAADILSTLQAQADLVVVSTGALHLSAGALVWAQAGESAIVVASRDRSRRDDVTSAVESLRLVGADVAGTVLAERRRGMRRGGRTAAASSTYPDAFAYADPARGRPDAVPAGLGTEPVLEFEEITRPSPTSGPGPRPRGRRGPPDGAD